MRWRGGDGSKSANSAKCEIDHTSAALPRDFALFLPTPSNTPTQICLLLLVYFLGLILYSISDNYVGSLMITKISSPRPPPVRVLVYIFLVSYSPDWTGYKPTAVKSVDEYAQVTLVPLICLQRLI